MRAAVRGPRPLFSVGDEVKAGAYRVMARFHRSVLLQDSRGHPCFVVNREIGAGPLNVVARAPLEWVTAAENVRWVLKAGELEGVPVYSSSWPEFPENTAHRLCSALGRWLDDVAPADSLISLFQSGQDASREVLPMDTMQRNRDARFILAFRLAEAGRWTDFAGLIRGCGAGLTPSGDDFLSGVMLGMRLTGAKEMRTVARAARGGNVVSNAFLSLAARGRLNEPLKRWMLNPTPKTLVAAAALGHTSGVDLLCGMRWFLERHERRLRERAAAQERKEIAVGLTRAERERICRRRAVEKKTAD